MLCGAAAVCVCTDSCQINGSWLFFVITHRHLGVFALLLVASRERHQLQLLVPLLAAHCRVAAAPFPAGDDEHRQPALPREAQRHRRLGVFLLHADALERLQAHGVHGLKTVKNTHA